MRDKRQSRLTKQNARKMRTVVSQLPLNGSMESRSASHHGRKHEMTGNRIIERLLCARYHTRNSRLFLLLPPQPYKAPIIIPSLLKKTLGVRDDSLCMTSQLTASKPGANPASLTWKAVPIPVSHMVSLWGERAKA